MIESICSGRRAYLNAGIVAEPSEMSRRTARSRSSPSTFVLESGGP